MKKTYFKTFLFCCTLLASFFSEKSNAQTTLAAGDLFFTGYDATYGTNNASAADRFSFVLLTNISSGTTIYFTERGFFTSTWQASGSTEGTIRWIAGTALPIGTEVYITAYTATVNGTTNNNGSVTQVLGGNPISGLSFSTSGDQVIAFQNTNGDPTAAGTTYIAGLHWGTCSAATDAAWDTVACASGPTTSYMPPDLSQFSSAIWAGNPGTGGAYTQGSFNGAGSPFASIALAREALRTKSNWNFGTALTSAAPVAVPSGAVAFGAPPTISASPANRSTCANSSTTFSVAANGVVTGYKWQVNSGSGYTNLSNGNGYSGVFTAVLTINPTSTTMSGKLYRCVVSNTYGEVNSGGGLLTVSNMTTTGSQVNVACFNGNSGSATVNVSGGVPGYSYSWSPFGGDGATASGLSAGNYIVTITDALGCTTTQSFDITQPADMLTVSGTQTNVSCNGGANGTISATASGGIPDYTFSWSTGANSPTITGLSAGTYTVTVSASNGCTADKTFTITAPSPIAISTSQSNVSCFNGANGTASANVTGGTGNFTYDWTPGNPSGDGSASVSGLRAGTYTLNVTDTNGCTMSKNITISQPSQIIVTGSQTNVSCNSQNDGAATVSVTGGSGIYSYAWFPSGGNGPTASNLSPGSYIAFIFDTNGCSASRSFVITEGGVTTWDGTNWSNGIPNLNMKAVFNGSFTSTSDLAACGLVVNGTAQVRVQSGHDFTIANSVVVAPTATLIFDNNANLIQNSNAANTGNVTIKRNAMMRRLDYVYWGTPVSGQILQSFSEFTTSNRFYTYSETTNAFVTVNSPSTTTMVPPQGYIIRAPNTFLDAPAPKQLFTGEFTGTPNNGNFSTPLTVNSGGFNMLGNPYPSPINANLFLQQNPGTLYFWTHTTPSGNINYAAYNIVGSAATAGSEIPNGTIQTGQGFLLLKTSAGNANFTNAMRVGNNNGQFFRTTTSEASRFWLNLKQNESTNSQMLVGYTEGATNGMDEAMDGKRLGSDGSTLSTIIDGTPYIIQGRALPFTATDIVPLEFKAAATGNYTIELDHADGIFATGQNIFLQDNHTGVVHNLSNNAYDFISEAGSFNDRFAITYTNTALGVGDPDTNEKDLIVYRQQDKLLVNTVGLSMVDLKVFDIQGRLIGEQQASDPNVATIEGLMQAHQVLVVQILLQDGTRRYKKLIF